MYENTVNALRCYAKDEECHRCEYFSEAGCDIEEMLFDAADAIEELQKLTDAQLDIINQQQAYLTKQRWIPITERLPGAGEIVLVYGKKGGIYTAEHNRNAMWPGTFWKLNSKSHHCEPTHWMPLPMPPKGE